MSTKYDILRNYQYRHAPSLVVTDVQRIEWKSKPLKVNIWFLVFYHHASRYNIEVRTWYNDEGATLKKIVRGIHEEFISEMNFKFTRERYQTYKHKEAQHIVAIEPIQEKIK